MSDDSLVAAPLASDNPSRVLTDAEGRTWIVREMLARPLDRRSTPTLVFATDEIMRRVRDYPANWSELSDRDLYALSLGR